MIGLHRHLSSLPGRVRRAWPILALLACVPAAHAADALNGKNLYLNGPTGGGTSCATCHGTSPTANVNHILNGANNPGAISGAITANTGGMGTLFNGRFTTAEIADIAAFIGNPTVTAAPAASVSPASLSFAATTVGQSASALSTTLSNTGNAALTVGTISVSGTAAGDYSISGGTCTNGTSLAAGTSCTVQVGFTPSASGTRSASLVIAHNATGGSSTVALAGTGNAVPQATVALSANAIDFGALVSGTSSPARSVTVSNSGQAALTFSSITVGGTNAGVFSLGGTCSTATSVPAGGSCTVTVTANSSGSGAFSGNLSLASNASNGAVSVALSGTVSAPAPAVSASPSAVAFGSQTIGAAAATQAVTLSNTGNVALALNGISVSGASSVTIASQTCGTTLAVGANCTVTLSFLPTTAGAAAATLAVTSNAAPLQVTIAGTGTTAPVAQPALSEAGPVAFADTQVGKSAAVHTITLSNNGTAAMKVSSLVLDGAQASDFVLGGTCAVNASVAAAASCTIDVGFRPTAAGQRAATMMLMTDAGSQFTVALGGTGVAVPVPMLTANPQSFDFGAADVNGNAPTHRITLTNTGGNAATVTAATFTGPFALQSDATGCAAVPFTLQPGASCDVVVRFTPVGAGDASGSMALAADGGGAWTVALTGKGNVQTAQTMQNTGAGGCSAATNGNDPVLALLVVLSFGVLGWRRFVRKEVK
ncbi:choice-of-anchor D domain-containing protein [Massilia sp. TW-1]|uniref:Choice-of-anchor D domain-containing protein n=1 Tax=Telluria antibiotica TaxID=2717319 RepID=A0ABX0PAE0_9BURK|nr:choice-of-anchor D domain-containing protein [Telluria antibiotica]NIA53140.1 choice-of-anchor D domain-containing protein [Telluria antibiotica]